MIEFTEAEKTRIQNKLCHTPGCENYQHYPYGFCCKCAKGPFQLMAPDIELKRRWDESRRKETA